MKGGQLNFGASFGTSMLMDGEAAIMRMYAPPPCRDSVETRHTEVDYAQMEII